MRLRQVYIKGFRNFKEAKINFNKQTLVIGANDVGKTNLFYAIRLLLDKGFSQYDYELSDSDFYAYEKTDEIIIRLYFDEITEEVLLSVLKGKISEDGETVIEYDSVRNGGEISYSFKMGKSDDEEDLKEIQGPFYKKYLNIKYIGSKRDLWGFINKNKTQLLKKAKEDRTEPEKEADEELYSSISGKLEQVDNEIPNLNYVKNATDHINEELDNLSIHNKEQKVVFDTSSTEVDKVIERVNLSSKYQDHNLILGGDGRLNQIYLSLWISQNEDNIENEVSIICIEEPEAYLHPHQQRKLASYLASKPKGQILLSSHSPQIASEFSPNSIVRLYKKDKSQTLAASNGCSEIIKKGFEDFGYRMSIIPAEAFFSDFVVLIEGPSELVFYKTLAKYIDVDLDKLNVSVLDVIGVGFKPFIAILNALDIDWCLRTDNDIMKIPYHEAYRYAGIQRCLDFLHETFDIDDDERNEIEKLSPLITGFSDKEKIPLNVQKAANRLIELFEEYGIFLSKKDLEEDLCHSPLRKSLHLFYGDKDCKLTDQDIIDKMKDKKAVNMFDFLKKKATALSTLKDDPIAKPLLFAKEDIENQYGSY